MSRDSFTFDPHQNDGLRDREIEGSNTSRQIPTQQARDLREGVGFDLPPDRSPRPAREQTPGAYSLGNRTLLLRESELKTMADVGTFRVVAAPDLAQFVYGGDAARMERELRRLKEQLLVTDRTVPTSGRKSL